MQPPVGSQLHSASSDLSQRRPFAGDRTPRLSYLGSLSTRRSLQSLLSQRRLIGRQSLSPLIELLYPVTMLVLAQTKVGFAKAGAGICIGKARAIGQIYRQRMLFCRSCRGYSKYTVAFLQISLKRASLAHLCLSTR